MPEHGTNGAVRRSSEPNPVAREQDARRTVIDTLNERRLTRERIVASLLLCPGKGPVGER